MLVKYFGIGLTTATLLGMTLPLQAPATAQMCVPLPVVGASGTTVNKSVSAPSTGVTGSNWNTDFVVRSNTSFRRYIATVTPKNGGTYDLQMNLKYNNDTADQVYNQGSVALAERQPFRFSGVPRQGSNPYQVNVLVGGVSALGNSYTLSVVGCR